MAISSKLQVKRGRYGSSKVKAFIALGNGIWTTRQLCVLTGIGYYSLGRTLPRWVKFGYVVRETIIYAGDYTYTITTKARSWLRLAAQYLPNYDLFLDELNNWQDQLTDGTINRLLCMPFKDFVTSLDEMIREFRKNNG